jgi:translation initiation factor IF-2
LQAAKAREPRTRNAAPTEEKEREEERARRRAEAEAKEREERSAKSAQGQGRGRRPPQGRGRGTPQRAAGACSPLRPPPRGGQARAHRRWPSRAGTHTRASQGRRRPCRPEPWRRPAGERRSGKLTVNQALAGGEGGRQRSLAAMKRKQERQRQKAMGGSQDREKVVRDVQVPETIVVSELANRMAERVADVVKALMNNGMMVTQNQPIDADTAELIVEEFGHKVQRVSDADVEDVIETADDKDRIFSRVPRSSRSWAMSTTARPRFSTRSARRMSSRARPAASRSISAPTR